MTITRHAGRIRLAAMGCAAALVAVMGVLAGAGTAAAGPVAGSAAAAQPGMQVGAALPRAAAAIPCGAKPFDDVATTRTFCRDIGWLKAQGITEGYPDGTFNPSGTVTREAMSAFLYRLGNPGKKDPVCVGTIPYPDVAVTSPFCGTISWLKAQNVTGGYADGGFHPSDDVTREAMSAFLYRIGNPGKADPTCTASSFTDVEVSNLFCGTINWIKARGITTGAADGGFHPGEAVSRDAMAAFLHRLADSLLVPVTLGSGSFTVGPDIPAGRYVVTAKSGETGRFGVIGDPRHPVDEALSGVADTGVPSVTVTLNVGDIVKISGLSAATFTPAVPKLRTALTTGSWLVGRDIAPGSYVAAPGKGQSGTLSVNVNSPTVLLDDAATAGSPAQRTATVTLAAGDRIDIDMLRTVSFTATK